MKLPIVFDANWINTWGGAFQANRLIDVFAISVRNDNGIREFYLTVFNVGLRLTAESRANYERRQKRWEQWLDRLIAKCGEYPGTEELVPGTVAWLPCKDGVEAPQSAGEKLTGFIEQADAAASGGAM